MHESLLVKWLRGLIYSTAFIPLVIFAEFISPFHFGKVILLRTIVEVMAVLYLLLVWRDRSYLPKSNPILWAFVAFTGVFTLTTITSVSPLQSFWGTLERMGGLFTFWHYLAFSIITVSVLRTRRDWQKFLDFIVAAGLVSALYGYLQRFDITIILGSGARERIFGTIGNPALFAGYEILVAYLALTLLFMKRAGPSEEPRQLARRGMMAIGIGLGSALLMGLFATAWDWPSGLWVVPLGYAVYGVYLLVAQHPRGARWFYGAVAGLTFLAVIMTAVRGSLIAIAVGSLAFALSWSIVNHSKRAKNALVLGIAALAVFVFLAMALRNTSLVQNSPYLTRITDFSSQTTTVQTRVWAWEAGFKGWSENFKTVTVGWGPENFNIPFSKYFNPKFFTGPGAETFFDRAHNMFIEVTVTMGVLGLLAYVSMFVMLFRALFRMMKLPGDERVVGIGFTALTIAYIIHNCFIFDTSANFITFFTLLAFATHAASRGLDPSPALSAGRPEPRAANLRLPRWTGMQKTTAVVLGIGVVVLVYNLNLRPSLANYTTTRAIVAGWQGNWVSAVNDFQQAIDYNTPAGRYEFRHRFAQYILETSTAADVSKVTNFNDVTLQAIADVQQNVAQSPQDYLPLLYLSRLYIILGRSSPTSPYNDQALQYSMAALKISPTFVRTYYEVAQAYLNKGDLSSAFDWFKQAKDLNPDVGTTWWYMGIVRYQMAAKTEDTAGMKEAVGYLTTAVQKGYSLSENDGQKLISAYAQFGDIASTVPILEQLTKSNPDKSQYWGSLATAYARVGRAQDAIAAARKVIELNPTDTATKTEAEQFIKSLGGTP